MLTLSYGYKKPQSGDKGPTVFPALEDNITRLNDHNHDGTDSAKLGPDAGVATSQSIPAGSWALVADGIYKQTVTLTGLLFDNIVMQFRFSTGEVFQPLVKKLTANTYEVYINDNTQTLTVYYR